MLNFFRRNKSENPATLARKAESQRDEIRSRIEDIESRIANGTHVPDDAKILANLKAELEGLR